MSSKQNARLFGKEISRWATGLNFVQKVHAGGTVACLKVNIAEKYLSFHCTNAGLASSTDTEIERSMT